MSTLKRRHYNLPEPLPLAVPDSTRLIGHFTVALTIQCVTASIFRLVRFLLTAKMPEISKIDAFRRIRLVLVKTFNGLIKGK